MITSWRNTAQYVCWYLLSLELYVFGTHRCHLKLINTITTNKRRTIHSGWEHLRKREPHEAQESNRPQLLVNWWIKVFNVLLKRMRSRLKLAKKRKSSMKAYCTMLMWFYLFQACLIDSVFLSIYVLQIKIENKNFFHSEFVIGIPSLLDHFTILLLQICQTLKLWWFW